MALVIVVGAAAGWRAALETGEPWRFLGTGVFLGIMLPVHAWKFHLPPGRERSRRWPGRWKA
jgi:hypothetical protein